MSVYQAAPVASPPQPGVSGRPAVLTAAVGAALAVTVLNIISSITILAAGMDMVRQQIADHPIQGGEPIDPSLVDITSDRAEGLQTIFAGLAYTTIFWAVALAVLAFFARGGGRAVRVLCAVILAISALVKAADVVTSVPMFTLILDVLVVIVALAAVVLFFLPAANAYGRARRMALTGR
jgi:hypothetical protein